MARLPLGATRSRPSRVTRVIAARVGPSAQKVTTSAGSLPPKKKVRQLPRPAVVRPIRDLGRWSSERPDELPGLQTAKSLLPVAGPELLWNPCATARRFPTHASPETGAADKRPVVRTHSADHVPHCRAPGPPVTPPRLRSGCDGGWNNSTANSGYLFPAWSAELEGILLLFIQHGCLECASCPRQRSPGSLPSSTPDPYNNFRPPPDIQGAPPGDLIVYFIKNYDPEELAWSIAENGYGEKSHF